MFGPCDCCDMYFCHGTCEMNVYDDDDLKESETLHSKFKDNLK